MLRLRWQFREPYHDELDARIELMGMSLSTEVPVREWRTGRRARICRFYKTVSQSDVFFRYLMAAGLHCVLMLFPCSYVLPVCFPCTAFDLLMSARRSGSGWD
ncbi:hypothetical protein VTN49DRAFT_4626 [Thermomyces lanuginosus]|uniref:uncharacterized protein n=1 Tax=Thermomyces lanuginosus TaxID=5541 RepID=UPI0037447DFF